MSTFSSPIKIELPLVAKEVKGVPQEEIQKVYDSIRSLQLAAEALFTAPTPPAPEENTQLLADYSYVIADALGGGVIFGEPVHIADSSGTKPTLVQTALDPHDMAGMYIDAMKAEVGTGRIYGITGYTPGINMYVRRDVVGELNTIPDPDLATYLHDYYPGNPITPDLPTPGWRHCPINFYDYGVVHQRIVAAFGASPPPPNDSIRACWIGAETLAISDIMQFAGFEASSIEFFLNIEAPIK